MAESVFEKLAKSILIRGAKEIFKKIFEKKTDPAPKNPAPPSISQNDTSKVHP